MKNEDLKEQILGRYDAAENYLVNKRDKWDEYEDLFHNVLSDDVSGNTKSQMFDPVLATMAIERSARVMAQLPVGKVRGLSYDDVVSEKLMNMVLERYVIPNANSQFDMLTKFRMVDLYSNLYGNFFTFVDWVVKDNGYIGPDVWLLPIRDVFPQVGAVSIDDSDYIIIRTWKPKSYFEALKDKKNFINIKETLTAIDDHDGDKQDKGARDKSRREDSAYPDPIPANKSGYFSILSMYEKDRWVDYVPVAKQIIRDTKNPHDNEELPVTCKHSIPLIDDFMGMGDFERGKTEQYALNSLWNLYMDAVKISIFPPTLVNKDMIADVNSIKWGPAEKWLIRGPSTSNAAQVLNLTPQGTSTFNNVYQALRGSMQNQFGTTFTDVSASTDTLMGKTPQALKMQQSREGSRDNSDKFYMERYLKDTLGKMVNLIAKKQPKQLTLRLFGEEIEELFTNYPELVDVYNENKGILKVGKGRFRNILFDYEIVSGSTYQADKDAQQENLISILRLFQKSPDLMQVLQQNEGKRILLSEIIKRVMIGASIQDWDKIMVDNNAPNPQDVKSQATQMLTQSLQEAGLPQESIPPELINQIPPEPNASY